MQQTAVAATRNRNMENEAAAPAASCEWGPASLTCPPFLSIMSSVMGRKRLFRNERGQCGVTGRMLRRLSTTAVMALALSFFWSPSPGLAMRGDVRTGWGHASQATVFAAGRDRGRAPYGISEEGEYGEQKEVASADQAREILKEYFAKKDVKIGKITEKKLYFEAEIRDGEGNLVDVVVVDKRTGRMRSIY
jgi:hypothetical protein